MFTARYELKLELQFRLLHVGSKQSTSHHLTVFISQYYNLLRICLYKYERAMTENLAMHPPTPTSLFKGRTMAQKLVAGISPWRPEFDCWSVSVVFVVGKVTLR